MKKCTKCLTIKGLTEFYKQSRNKDGLRHHCKTCTIGHEPYKKPSIEKLCPHCGIIKPLEMYYRKTIKKKYKALDGTCKECRNKQRQNRRKANPLKESNRLRNIKYKVNFGISLEKYNKLLILQDYRCKICNNHQDNLTKRLAVDHCHNSLKVRGLLCTNCNISLGLLKENTEILTNAIKYLTDNQIVNNITKNNHLNILISQLL